MARNSTDSCHGELSQLADTLIGNGMKTNALENIKKYIKIDREICSHRLFSLTTQQVLFGLSVPPAHKIPRSSFLVIAVTIAATGPTTSRSVKPAIIPGFRRFNYCVSNLLIAARESGRERIGPVENFAERDLGQEHVKGKEEWELLTESHS